MVFDLDGTLVDSHNLHAHILTEVLAEYGISRRLEHVDASSTSLRLFLMRLLPPEHWKDVDLIYLKYAREFSKNLSKVRLMPGAVEALKGIEDRKAIFTAMPRTVAEALLRTTGIGGFFDKVVCGDDVERTKPDPEGLMLIAQELGDRELVVVGNGINDVRAAKNYGAISVFFSRDGRENKNADFNIHDLRELPGIVSDLKIANRRIFKL